MANGTYRGAARLPVPQYTELFESFVPPAPQRLYYDPMTGTSIAGPAGAEATSIGTPTLGADFTSTEPPLTRQQAYSRELQTNLAISGAAQGLQLGAQFVPTAGSREARQFLKKGGYEEEKAELEAAAAAVGLSSQERALMQQQSMAPVQAMARESRLREQAAAASAGGTRSARAQVQSRQAERQAVQQAATQIGLGIEQADIQEAARETALIAREEEALEMKRQQMIAYRDERQRQQLSQVGQFASGAAGLAGQVRGAQAIKGMPAGDLEGLNPIEQELLMRSMATGNYDQLAMVQLAKAMAEQ